MKDLIIFGRIAQSGTDAENFATQKVEYLGKLAEALMVFPYGMHANIPADSLALMFSVQGHPDNRAAIGWTPNDRPTLTDGEVAFYHPPTDAFIIWRENGDLEIEAGTGGAGNINITALNTNITSNVNITGNVTITGNLTVTGSTVLAGITSNGKNVGDTHTHGGSPTAPTGPVSNTGVPV
jgi:hypothetical protein